MRTIRTPDSAELSGQVSSGGVDVVALSKVYGRGDTAVTALNQVTVSFAARSFTAVMGPSGSGKTTLLQCAAGLDRPTGGQVWIGGRDIARLRDPRATRFRRSHVGFVFQAFNLLGSLDVAGNIALPIHLAGGRVDQGWMRELVDRVGLAGRMHHRPAELSGGQQQRVAIARALVTRPRVIFADEPTGALDSRSGREILALLREAVDELGRTVVMVTHDPVAAAATDRLCLLADGRLLRDVPDPSADDAAALFAQLGH